MHNIKLQYPGRYCSTQEDIAVPRKILHSIREDIAVPNVTVVPVESLLQQRQK